MEDNYYDSKNVIDGKSRDYRLVKVAKLGDKRALTLLYNAHQGTIAWYWKRLSPLIRDQERDDYFQDAYFRLIAAVNYVNLEKIDKWNWSHRWKFYKDFTYFLMKDVYVYNSRSDKDMTFERDISDNESKLYGTKSPTKRYLTSNELDQLNSCSSGKRYAPERYLDVMNAEQRVEDFLSSLEDIDRTIFDAYFLQGSQKLGRTAKALNLSYGVVSKSVKATCLKAEKMLV